MTSYSLELFIKIAAKPLQIDMVTIDSLSPTSYDLPFSYNIARLAYYSAL